MPGCVHSVVLESRRVKIVLRPILKDTMCVCQQSVCRQTAVPCNCLHGQPVLDSLQTRHRRWTVTHGCRAAVILHDGGDISDWRSLAGGIEICRPVNNLAPAE